MPSLAELAEPWIPLAGYRINLRVPAQIHAIEATTLTATILDPSGQPVRFKPWFGALAHAIFFREGTLDCATCSSETVHEEHVHRLSLPRPTVSRSTTAPRRRAARACSAARAWSVGRPGPASSMSACCSPWPGRGASSCNSVTAAAS